MINLGWSVDEYTDKKKLAKVGYLSTLPAELLTMVVKFQFSRACHACPDCGLVLIHSCRHCMLEGAGEEFGPRCASCSRDNFWECMRIRSAVKKEIAELETMVQALEGKRWEFYMCTPRQLSGCDEYQYARFGGYAPDAELIEKRLRLRERSRNLYDHLVNGRELRPYTAQSKRYKW